MASLNPSIILSGAQPNLVGRVAQGMGMAQVRDEMQRENALADFYKQNGQGLVAGDPGAINALAAISPEKASAFQQTHIDNQRATEQHQMAMEEGRRQAAQWAQQVSDRERAASAERIKSGLAAASNAQTPEQWDALAQQYGAPELVGKFNERDAVIGFYTGQVQELEKPEYAVTDSGYFYDKNNPQAGAQQVPGLVAEPKPLSGAGKFYADQQAGLIPPGETYKAGNSVTVNSGPNEGAFQKKTGELLAQETAEIVSQGSVAQRNMGAIDRLEQALQTAPQGGMGALANWASGLGIKTEGASELEVADAIISQLVPQQRPPGSGTMSDADLALFRRSLPRIINSPGGNQEIVKYLRSIGEYDVKRAQIARALQLGQIDHQTAAQEYAALGNPLEPLRAAPTTPKATEETSGAQEVEINGKKYRVERLD